MKSDKPILKALICGSALSVVLFALIPRPEIYFVRYSTIFIVSFTPAIFAAVCAFFSKRPWKWKRFLIVTIIFFVAGIVPLALISHFLPQRKQPLPTITFSPEVSSSWTMVPENSIVDTAKEPMGSQLLLINKDHKRRIWVAAQNSPEDFDVDIDNWKSLIIGEQITARCAIRKNEFAEEVKNGQKIARLYLAVQKNNTNYYIISQAWIHQRFFIMCEAMGDNVEVSNDQEIAGVISRVVVK